MGKKHLLIPDTHIQPEINNTPRVIALGKLIREEAPDVVWCGGDWGSFDSLSNYDKGKKSHEGRRYQKDLNACNKAVDQLENEMAKGRNKPRKVFSLGNHENRIDRAVECNAELEGTMSTDDLNFKDHGWEVHAFLKTVCIDGVHYSHYHPSGVMARPIGGENAAANLLKKHFVSCVAVHSHLYDYAERTRPDGIKIQGLVAGCYFNHSMPYAASVEHMRWSGITILEEVKNGTFDFHRISLARLLAR